MRKFRQAILSILITSLLMVMLWLINRSQLDTRTRPVVVVNRPIPAGNILTRDDLDTVMLPDHASLLNYASDPAAVIGQWALTSLETGEFLHHAKIGTIAEGLDFPQPGTGRRLMTIKLEAADANGYWLAAGNQVDLYIIPRQRDDEAWPQVVRAIRVVTILNENGSAAPAVQGSSNQPALLCLDVSEEQAALLSLAEKQADIKIAVINE
jgi:Flp pilus assembly protein CpaB